MPLATFDEDVRVLLNRISVVVPSNDSANVNSER